ncbi:hypothetical protein FISHEDRAFT_57416 [Fistulina hepatica ATCC 64428]|uniref:Uncharacterized protein n=1 Tax=Fistulina hepatica ATCC 64428 TaxID=1128425 RepID=A0A0D7AJW1_9AGAR|nr:hypothetical protein FISHEDRAFT_57416 [Fistulina hepatica ATCC 64428]
MNFTSVIRARVAAKSMTKLPYSRETKRGSDESFSPAERLKKRFAKLKRSHRLTAAKSRPKSYGMDVDTSDFDSNTIHPDLSGDVLMADPEPQTVETSSCNNGSDATESSQVLSAHAIDSGCSRPQALRPPQTFPEPPVSISSHQATAAPSCALPPISVPPPTPIPVLTSTPVCPPTSSPTSDCSSLRSPPTPALSDQSTSESSTCPPSSPQDIWWDNWFAQSASIDDVKPINIPDFPLPAVDVPVRGGAISIPDSIDRLKSFDLPNFPLPMTDFPSCPPSSAPPILIVAPQPRRAEASQAVPLAYRAPIESALGVINMPPPPVDPATAIQLPPIIFDPPPPPPPSRPSRRDHARKRESSPRMAQDELRLLGDDRSLRHLLDAIDRTREHLSRMEEQKHWHKEEHQKTARSIMARAVTEEARMVGPIPTASSSLKIKIAKDKVEQYHIQRRLNEQTSDELADIMLVKMQLGKPSSSCNDVDDLSSRLASTMLDDAPNSRNGCAARRAKRAVRFSNAMPYSTAPRPHFISTHSM